MGLWRIFQYPKSWKVTFLSTKQSGNLLSSGSFLCLISDQQNHWLVEGKVISNHLMPFLEFVLMGGKTPKNQLFSKPSILLFLGLVFSSLCFVSFLLLGFGLFSLLIVPFPLMILSTIFLFTSTKKKPFSDENPSGELQYCSQIIHLENELTKPMLESIEENGTAQESKNVINHEHKQELEDTPSESEGDVSESSESFELKWQNLPISESSFSEEEDENLIEINLPGSESSGLEDEPNLANFMQESIFRQKGFMEILADINEVNEEDNLIEIDISMGSIKCPRFEIEA